MLMKAECLLENFDRIAESPGSIAHLRRFILDLAVRGKLVEQDSNDEPASELLKRIQVEKEKLVQEGEIKRFEKFEPIKSADFKFVIPNGWQIVQMGWISRKLGAGSTPLGGKSVYQNEGVPFLRSQNVHNNGLRLDDVALIPESIHNRMSGTHIKKHDVLLNITGASIGRCALVPDTFQEGNVSQHVAIIRLFISDMRDFIHLSLISPFFQRLIDDVQVGVSREGLSMQNLKLFPMLIPPLAEQHRIVVKVDELMGLCDQLEAAQKDRESKRDRLVASSLHHLNQATNPAEFRDRAQFYFDRLPKLTTRSEHIKQLRQTILNLAVCGKLVPQDPNDEPASELLKRIQVEKKRLIKEGNIKPEKEMSSIDGLVQSFEIPKGWKWIRWNTIALKIGDIDHKMPDTVKDGIPYVSPRDFLPDNQINFDGAKRISSDDFVRLSAKIKPDVGDLIYPRYGTIGENRLVVEQRDFLASYSCAVIKVLRGFINPRFQYFFSISPYCRQQARAAENKTTQANVGIKSIQDFIFPLPPLAEQHRIVAKVDELMGLCDRLEAQIDITETDSRRLLESLLHQARSNAA
jgi:type I restriction enzyme, S subunit